MFLKYINAGKKLISHTKKAPLAGGIIESGKIR